MHAACIDILSGVFASEITYIISVVALTSIHSLTPDPNVFTSFDYREK